MIANALNVGKGRVVRDFFEEHSVSLGDAEPTQFLLQQRTSTP